jgi:hypothetical protein
VMVMLLLEPRCGGDIIVRACVVISMLLFEHVLWW